MLKQAISVNEKHLEKHFKEYRQYTSVDMANVLQANHNFLRAMDEKDIPTLKNLWMESNDAICLLSQEDDVIVGYRDIILYLAKLEHNYVPYYAVDMKLHFVVRRAEMTGRFTD